MKVLNWVSSVKSNKADNDNKNFLVPEIPKVSTSSRPIPVGLSPQKCDDLPRKPNPSSVRPMSALLSMNTNELDSCEYGTV